MAMEPTAAGQQFSDADDDLLARARSGDDAAFALLCEKHRRRVWRVVASVARRAADADDLAQEAIVRAWCSLHSYRGEASFEAWLCRIALNAAHDHLRSAWRRRVLVGIPLFGHAEGSGHSAGFPNAAEASVEFASEQRETQRRVRSAVAALGSGQRNPIWLIYFEGFTLAEVARLENTPESTIRSRVQTGLRQLERSLRDLNPALTTLESALCLCKP